MSTIENKHWYVIINDGKTASYKTSNPLLDNHGAIYDEGHIDGKWNIFITKQDNRRFEIRKEELITTVAIILAKGGLTKAYIDKKNLNQVIIFTSADTLEIYRTKQLIIKLLKPKPENIIWKAEHESETDWDSKRGKLYLFSQILDGLQEQRRLTYYKRVHKAERVDKMRVQPLVMSFLKTLLGDTTMARNSMVIKPSFKGVSYEIDPLSAFVIMPFGEKWAADTFDTIKDACTKCHIKAKRADTIFDTGLIVDNIWKLINESGLIIADITKHNANVFYELGIAHTIGKKVILIRKKDGESPPFDIQFWRYYDYETSRTESKKFEETLVCILKEYTMSLNISQ